MAPSHWGIQWKNWDYQVINFIGVAARSECQPVELGVNREF